MQNPFKPKQCCNKFSCKSTQIVGKKITDYYRNEASIEICDISHWKTIHP